MNPKKNNKAATPALSRGRTWLFRLTVALLALPLCLLLLEGGLRLFGYGFSPSFFLEELGALRTNPAFSRLCFPPELARIPVSDRLADPKPEGEYRIFILGASAAQGFPEPAYSVGRILEVMLEESYPKARFKVVNAALAAINSHIVLPIAEDCAEHEADLLVVYMGNNEVVGPYGPGTVLPDFSPSLTRIRASLAIKRARTGQLLADLMNIGRKKSPGWADMEMFVENPAPADDPRMQRVYDHFKSNLSDIVELAREKGLPMIVSNLATNPEDSPRQAAYDADINAVVSEVAAGRAEHDIYFVDAAGAFAAAGIPGEELFDDHVHMNFDGNFLLARELFKKAAALLPSNVTRGVTLPEAPSLQLCARRLVYTEWEHMPVARLWELSGLYEAEIAESPDDHWLRIGYARLLARLGETEGAVQQLSAILTDNPSHREALWELSNVLAGQARYEEEARYLHRVLEIEPFSMQARHRQAINLRQRGKKEEAVQAYSRMLKDYPGNARVHGGLGRMLLSQGKVVEATAQFREALALDPDLSEVRMDLVQLMVSRGNRPAAIAECEEWIRQSPDASEPLLSLAAVLERDEEFEAAAEQYSKAIALDPRSIQARTSYDNLLQKRGVLAEATSFHRQMLESYPDIPAGHYLLGISLARQGNSSEAVAELREELKMAPDSHLALGALVRILGSDPNPQIRDGASAVAAAERLAAVAPGDPATFDAMAIAYAEFGDFDRALEAQTEAVQLVRASGQRDQAILRDYMARLQLYRNGTPFRQ